MISFCLPIGACIKLNNVNYVIDACIGHGGHCIVYDAHSTGDTPRKVRIKECFPVNKGLYRQDQCVIWKNEFDKKSAYASFKSTYQKHIFFQDDQGLGNSFVKIIGDIDEANNTYYYILAVDHGVTFECDSSRSLVDVLKTLKSLSFVIGKYHKRGYLYLDLKPDNFMVFPSETRDRILLLDADSIIEKRLIQEEATSISFSEGWAAPELLLGNRRNITEQSDIYEIGVMLFRKIYNRFPENEDIGLYNSIDIPVEMFETIDNSIRSILTEIIARTITASSKRRFRSIYELINAIEKAIKICEHKVYIRSKIAYSDSGFVGRKRELDQIQNAFDSGKKIVFLHGFGGIGKTELAKKYSQISQNKFDVISFDTYRDDPEKGGIKKYVENIDLICEDDGDSNNDEFENKIFGLKKAVTPRTLFIIDNFDVQDDELLAKFLELDGKFLVTSRNDHGGQYGHESIQIELDVMDSEDLLELFANEYDGKITDSEKDYLLEIFEMVAHYTLIIPLLAKQLNATDQSIKQLRDDTLNRGLGALDNEEKLSLRKDGAVTQENLIAHVERVFPLSSFPEEYKYVLANMYDLKDHRNFTRAIYKKYTGCRNYNALNEVISRGFIKVNINSDNEKILSLHPIIEQVIERNLNDAEYHRHIIDYVFKQVITFSDSGRLEELKESIGSTFLLFVKVMKFLSPEKTEEYYVGVRGFLMNLFERGEVCPNNYLFNSSDFSRVASGEYFLLCVFNIFDYNRDGIIKSQSFYQFMVISFMGYSCSLQNGLQKDDIKRIRDAYRTYCFFIFLLIIEAINGEEKLNHEVLTSVLNAGYKLITVISKNLPVTTITDGSWLVGIDWNRYALYDSNELYWNMVFYRLAMEFVDAMEDIEKYLNVSGNSQLALMFEGMWSVVNYYQGRFIDPFLAISDGADINFDKIVCFEDGVMNPDENFEPPLFSKDKKQWAKELGKSVWDDYVLKTECPYEAYSVLLDENFLLEQPKSVQKSLRKHNLPKRIFEDSRLTEKQRKELLVNKVCGEVARIQYFNPRMNDSRIIEKYSNILNLYHDCIHFYEKEFFGKFGKTLDDELCMFYTALAYIKVVKHMDVGDVAGRFSRYLTARNYEKYPEKVAVIKKYLQIK